MCGSGIVHIFKYLYIVQISRLKPLAHGPLLAHKALISGLCLYIDYLRKKIKCMIVCTIVLYSTQTKILFVLDIKHVYCPLV